MKTPVKQDKEVGYCGQQEDPEGVAMGEGGEERHFQETLLWRISVSVLP